MQVRDVMTRKVISVTVGDSILSAARLMLQNKISGLPVVDAGGGVVRDHLVWVEPMSGVAFPSPEDQARQSERTAVKY